MNVRLPSFGNAKSIEGNRHVNRQLHYCGKEVTKVCMEVIGSVHFIIYLKNQRCLKNIRILNLSW